MPPQTSAPSCVLLTNLRLQSRPLSKSTLPICQAKWAAADDTPA